VTSKNILRINLISTNTFIKYDMKYPEIFELHFFELKYYSKAF